jgi:CNP1-like family
VLKIFAFVICVFAFSNAHAQNYPIQSPNIEEKTWVEEEVELPVFPKDENLMPFSFTTDTTSKFFVDSESIKVGEDGVVRYTLVVKSAGGAINVSVEGIRCDSKEWKSYAFGRRDGTWVKAKQAKWRTIQRYATIRHHDELRKYYFCPNDNIIKRPQQAISTFRRGGPNPSTASERGG